MSTDMNKKAESASGISTSGEGNKFGANSDPNPDLREDNDSSSAFEFNNMNEKKSKLATTSASSAPRAVRPDPPKPNPEPASVPSNPAETIPAPLPCDKPSSKTTSATASDPSNPVETIPAPLPCDKPSSKTSSETASPSSVTAAKSSSSSSKDDESSWSIKKIFKSISIWTSSDEKDAKPSSSTTSSSSKLTAKSLSSLEKKPVKHPIYDNKWEIPVDDSQSFANIQWETYDEIREKIKEHHEDIEKWLEDLIEKNEMLPMPFRPSSPEHKNDKFIRVAPEDLKDKEVWFLGDIHGDSLSFTAVLKAINSLPSSKNKIIVLLGDVFDRLSDYFEVFFQILLLMYKDNNIVWLSGNHDFVTYDESTDKFFSPTKPSEFTEWLNDPNGADGEFRQIARQITKLYSKLIDSLPAALYFPDGLFVSHGGFPHPHWYETAIKKWEDFNDSRFVYDFYWKRVHESKRQAMFSSSKGGELGYEDFDSFCNLLEERFMSPVSAFLRGHDHFPERVKVFDKYKKPVITINTICNTEDGSDPIGKYGYKTTPVIIKYNPKIPRDYVSYAKLDGIIEKILPLEAEKAIIAEELKEREAEIDEDNRVFNAKIDEDNRAFNAKIDEEKRAFLAKIDEEQSEHDAKIAKEQSEHDAKIAEEQRDHDAKIAVEQEKLDALKARKAQKDLEIQKIREESITGAAPKAGVESKGLEE